jgi:hypothetical protein
MNPYLEQTVLWQDFHTELLTAIRRFLIPRVGGRYIVQIKEHVYIHDAADEPRRRVGRADVSVGRGRKEAELLGAVGVLEAPAVVQLPEEAEERMRFLEVRDRQGRELVTVIELLGPSNKRAGEDREQYLTKRREILRSPAHLVEIDLLRGWTPMPMQERPACDYSVLISRAERRPAAGFWAIGLRDRLPVIPVPLRSGDPDALIDLQEALHSAYDGAGYGTYIYEGRPEPELAPSDVDWFETVLRSE